MGRKVINLLSLYPAEKLARWCLVTVKTARDWQAGRKRPSRRALKLLELHRSGRILGPEWEGWRVDGDRLIDPAGAVFERWQMEAHVVLYQIAEHCRRHHLTPQDSHRGAVKSARLRLVR